MDDPELQEIFTDPAHQEVIDLLKSARPATPPLDPHFRSYLRAKLMTEARQTLPRSASRSWFSFKPRTMALSMAAVAAGFLVVLGVQVYLRGGAVQPTPIEAMSPIANKTDVSATAIEPIQIQFSGPVDKNAVADSVVIEPATSVTKQWVGSTLVIIPDHALAPNTSYTVSLRPSSTPAAKTSPNVRPSPTVAPTPIVVHFSTVRPPIPPVTPPSFRSTNLTYGNDNRLDQSGTILNATWTSNGQLLATRPAGAAGPAGLPMPPSTPTPAASETSGNATDVWLLNPSGTPLKDLAQGARLPSAPASGNIFASWSMQANQASLDVRDLQSGALIATVATIHSAPDQPATWVGSDHLAYVANGALKVVDLHGIPLALPALGQVQHGSIAANASGSLLAVETVNGAVVLDLTAPSAAPTTLHKGATGFAWSPRGDLAFVVPQSDSTDLYVATDVKHPIKIATSPSGQTWSGLNWAPDASSLLLATKSTGSTSTPGLVVIDRDGTDPKPFGSSTVEYSAPDWSPSGALILFTRKDDATGGLTFQVATVSTSGGNAAEAQAIAEVDKFMKARLAGDRTAAQAELDTNGFAAYQNGNASLVSAPGTSFDRYYPVTVQLAQTNSNTFLIGVRTFIAKSGTEVSFFEEQLSVVQQSQRYVIDGVQPSAPQALSHGPTVVSVEVLETPPGQQVLVRFDSDMKAESVTSGTVLIKDHDGQPVQAQLTFDPNDHLATLAVKLRQGTYQLVVTTGVSDINGIALATEYDAPLVISR